MAVFNRFNAWMARLYPAAAPSRNRCCWAWIRCSQNPVCHGSLALPTGQTSVGEGSPMGWIHGLSVVQISMCARLAAALGGGRPGALTAALIACANAHPSVEIRLACRSHC